MTGISQVVATCFALTAFTVALVFGLAADNPPMTVLVRSLIVLIVCYGLGWLVGYGFARALVSGGAESASSHLDQDPQDNSVKAAETHEISVSSEVAEDEKVPAPL